MMRFTFAGKCVSPRTPRSRRTEAAGLERTARAACASFDVSKCDSAIPPNPSPICDITARREKSGARFGATWAQARCRSIMTASSVGTGLARSRLMALSPFGDEFVVVHERVHENSHRRHIGLWQAGRLRGLADRQQLADVCCATRIQSTLLP